MVARLVHAKTVVVRPAGPSFASLSGMTLTPNVTGAHLARFWATLACDQPCTVTFKLTNNGVDVAEAAGGLLTVKVDIMAPKVHRQFCLEAEVSMANTAHIIAVRWKVDYGQAAISDRRLSLHSTA